MGISTSSYSEFILEITIAHRTLSTKSKQLNVSNKNMQKQQVRYHSRIQLALYSICLVILDHNVAATIYQQKAHSRRISTIEPPNADTRRTIVMRRALKYKSSSPTQSPAPSTSPTSYPTQTSEPTPQPTEIPSASPTDFPINKPTQRPTTSRPINRPTVQPINRPTIHPIHISPRFLTEYPSSTPNIAPFSTVAQNRNGIQPSLTINVPVPYPVPVPFPFPVPYPAPFPQPAVYNPTPWQQTSTLQGPTPWQQPTTWQPPIAWQPPVAYYPPFLIPTTAAPISIAPTYTPIRAPSSTPSVLPTTDFFPDRPVAPVAWWLTPPKPSPVTWQELNPAAAALTQSPTALFIETPSSWWAQPQANTPMSVVDPDVINKSAVKLANFTIELRTDDGDFSVATLTDLLEEYFYAEMLFTNLYRVNIAVVQTNVAPMKESMLSSIKLAGVAYFDTAGGISTVPTFENLRTEQGYVLMDYKSLQIYFDEFFLLPGNGNVVTLVQTNVEGLQNAVKTGSTKKLSGGATAGTTIAALFVVGAIAGGIYFYLRIWRVKKRDGDTDDGDAAEKILSTTVDKRGSRRSIISDTSDCSSDGKNDEKQQKCDKQWRPILHSAYSTDDDIDTPRDIEQSIRKYVSVRKVKQPSLPDRVCDDSLAEQSMAESALSDLPTSIHTPTKQKRLSLDSNEKKLIFVTKPLPELESKEILVSYESISAASSADFTNQTELSGEYTNNTETNTTDYDIQTISQFDPDSYSMYTEHLVPPEKTSLQYSNTVKNDTTMTKTKSDKPYKETSPLNKWDEDIEDL